MAINRKGKTLNDCKLKLEIVKKHLGINYKHYNVQDFEQCMINIKKDLADLAKYERENDDLQFGHEIEQQFLNDYL